MAIVLEARDLAVERGGRRVLDVDALQVMEGETLAIIGPNGSGKSTLLLALANLLRAERGEVRFRERLVLPANDLAYRRRIGLVLQTPLLLGGSVGRNVATGLRFRGTPKDEVRARIGEWLDRLEIAHLRDRPARSLSGGEAQRVSLARAFALEPDILMLDEPFRSLDPPTRQRLLQLLRELLRDSAATTIFVTHDLDEALLLGDRVAVLLDGKLRQIGSPEQVFSAPADREIAAFVGVETVIAGRVTASDEGRVFVDAAGIQLEAAGESPVGRDVYLCLRPEDITLFVNHAATRSSARNRLQGAITEIAAQGPLVRVVVDCGLPVVSLITRASAREMALQPGVEVVAAFKATAIHLISH